MTEVSQSKKKRVLCVFGRILGGKTFSGILDEFLDQGFDFEIEHLDFLESDFSDYKPPGYTKISNTLAVNSIMRKKLANAGLDLNSYDFIFFQSIHLTPIFKKYIKKIPCIIALDATPKLGHVGNVQAYGIKAIVKSVLAKAFDIIWFNSIFKNVDFFLARTETVKNSLVTDYGVDPELVRVTYIPVPFPADKKVEKTSNGKTKLLFVGNDFERKGGPFLLNVFEKYLSDRAELLIISRDPTIQDRQWPDGVVYLGGLPRNDVLNMYNECDVFVLPTWRDELGLVLCEAIVSGMPVVVRDATAQHEFIENDSTGFLMPYESTEQEWAEKLNLLIDSQKLRAKFSEAARKKAKQLFSAEGFTSKIDEAIKAVLR